MSPQVLYYVYLLTQSMAHFPRESYTNTGVFLYTGEHRQTKIKDH